ncbi:MAG TPA: CsbD family protein [Acidimicrobiales bacterium]
MVTSSIKSLRNASVLTPLTRSGKGFTVIKKNGFTHLRHVTKGALNETTGKLVGNRRLEVKGALEHRLGTLQRAGAHLKKALRRP